MLLFRLPKTDFILCKAQIRTYSITAVNRATNAVTQFNRLILIQLLDVWEYCPKTKRSILRYYQTKESSRQQNALFKTWETIVIACSARWKTETFFTTIEEKRQRVVNTAVAVATAEALITGSSDEHLKLLDLESTTLAKTLCKRMGVCKRAASTSKPEIRELAKREAKLLLQYQVANLVEIYAVPH